jgi:hypothetical protein
MNDLHEKIASALEALTDVMTAKAMKELPKKAKEVPAPKAVQAAQPQAMPVKKAEDESFGSAYRRATGEDLPDEVAENPAARAAVEKLAAASLRVNDLGSPSERSDPSARREAPQGTRAERYKQAFDNFGEDLINSRR